MKNTYGKNIRVLFSLLFFSVASYAIDTIGRHPERFTEERKITVTNAEKHQDFVITSYQSELSQIYKAAARLEAIKENTPKDSAAYVDLDKNLEDIYARMQLAEKHLKKLKSQKSEMNEKDRTDLEFILADVREIIDLNAQPSE